MMTTMTGRVVDLGNLEWSLLDLASCLHYCCWSFQLIMFIILIIYLLALGLYCAMTYVFIHSQGFSFNRVIAYNNLSLKY